MFDLSIKTIALKIEPASIIVTIIKYIFLNIILEFQSELVTLRT